jgi:oxygen-independent coproporphyrinogen-3 oxidase
MVVNPLSMGVQDTNQEVQLAINRVQSTNHVASLIKAARQSGIDSINLDLVYGLSMQNELSFASKIQQVLNLDPERISLFNYAHMSSKFPAQRKIKDSWLPKPDTKFAQMRNAIREFTQNDYVLIGMDHFAKPHDDLVQALNNKRLVRNSRGYTTYRYTDLVGFGVSAISSICNVYSQNLKKPTTTTKNSTSKITPSKEAW